MNKSWMCIRFLDELLLLVPFFFICVTISNTRTILFVETEIQKMQGHSCMILNFPVSSREVILVTTSLHGLFIEFESEIFNRLRKRARPKSTEFTPNVSLLWFEQNIPVERSYTMLSLIAWPPLIEYRVVELEFTN